jgi:hydrogenase-1 operon protein HyaE
MTPESLATVPPLVARLVTACGACWVDASSVDGFVGGPGDRVLFFGGDPVRFPECLDVAVVLPELLAAFPGRLLAGVVAAQDEDLLARRWGVQRWPSLVFLRDGDYVATVAGMLDWTDYVQRVGEALRLAPSRAPTVGIPVVAVGAASCH